MFFALGFLISGLLALLFLPAFWRRAVRLSTRRLEMRLPLSMNEIVAERDQLRAEFALGQRRLEQRVEDLAATRAQDLAELGRRATRIAALEDDNALTRRDHDNMSTLRAAALADRLAAETETGAAHQALWGLEGERAALAADHATLRGEHETISDLAEQRRALVASLETRVMGHEASIRDLREAWERAREENLELTLARHKLEDERDHARADAAGNATRREQAETKAREARKRAKEIEEERREERRARLRVETDAASRSSALALAEAREAALRESHAAQLLTARGGEHSLLAKIEDLRTQNAALEGALASIRREVATLRGESSAAAPANGSTGDAAALRLAIQDIGSQVARMVEKLEAEAPDGHGQDLSGRVSALRGEISRAAE